jgi:predicted Zn-dependent protease with MMP-like domain
MDFENLTKLAIGEVRRTLADLPHAVRREAENVPIFFEEIPDAGDLAEGIEEDTLGLFDEGEAAAPTPRIRLWLVNIWDYSGGDEEVYLQEVRTTLLHELGHHLGWDEEDLEERGLG